MKNLRILVVFLLLITLFAGCSGGYRYVAKGENSYIVLGSLPDTESDSTLSGKEVANVVYFSSMAEMKSDIQSGNFTATELQSISRFNKDSSGKLVVCDIQKLYEATFPSSFPLKQISWSGAGYGFQFERTNGVESAYLSFRSAEAVNKTVQEDFQDPSYGSGIIKTEDVPEVNGTAYYFVNKNGEQRKYVQYTVTSGNTTLYVKERYNVGVLDYSMLTNVTVYGVNSVQCFEISINSLNYGTFTRPTMDELKAFGIREYVETVTE